MTPSPEAERLVELGNELLDQGRPEAEGAYHAAAKADPLWSVPWYNLGLLSKYQGRWRESLEFNQRAAELNESDQGVWWNLAIAATALGEWSAARRAWRQCGIELPDGDGPPDGDFGPVPLRLDPNGQGEVVWGRRIDPARARLVSIPLPTSPFRWGDVVLHDGAPQGFRKFRGRDIPVFNVLQGLVRSEHETFVVELGTADSETIDALSQVAHELEGAAEDWGSTTNILCRECSFGLPHEHESESNSPAHPHCGIAARNETHLRQILDRWLSIMPGADIVRWNPAPPRTQ